MRLELEYVKLNVKLFGIYQCFSIIHVLSLSAEIEGVENKMFKTDLDDFSEGFV